LQRFRYDKVPALTGRQVIKALLKVGWLEVGQKGSHVILKKTGFIDHITIPVHKGSTIPVGTLSRIIKYSGLDIEEFLKLLLILILKSI
jgi:predicted RNA binding protein YcfA (HicA-like mRNA interferase family)